MTLSGTLKDLLESQFLRMLYSVDASAGAPQKGSGLQRPGPIEQRSGDMGLQKATDAEHEQSSRKGPSAQIEGI